MCLSQVRNLISGCLSFLLLLLYSFGIWWSCQIFCGLFIQCPHSGWFRDWHIIVCPLLKAICWPPEVVFWLLVWLLSHWHIPHNSYYLYKWKCTTYRKHPFWVMSIQFLHHPWKHLLLSTVVHNVTTIHLDPGLQKLK